MSFQSTPFRFTALACVLGLSSLASLRPSHAGPPKLAGPDTEAKPEAVGSINGTFLSYERLKTRGDTSERDIVVYLESTAPGKFTPPASPVQVDQTKLKFVPHVLPILKGSTVGFSNGDSVKHNIYSSEDCCAMDIDMDAGGTSTKTFKQAGVVSIICRVHPDMSMWVISLDNPWFSHLELEKVKVDGESTYQSEFALDNVPPGSYTLTFWNKKLSPESFPVVVKAGVATELNVTIAKK